MHLWLALQSLLGYQTTNPRATAFPPLGQRLTWIEVQISLRSATGVQILSQGLLDASEIAGCIGATRKLRGTASNRNLQGTLLATGGRNSETQAIAADSETMFC